jgi:hypothetical protein
MLGIEKRHNIYPYNKKAPKFNEASLISSPKIPSEGSGKED